MQPGVTVVESTIEGAGLPSSTAIPVFVGFTDKNYGDESEPILQQIASMAEYQGVFGGAANPKADCALFHTVAHYFESGGEPCFIASVGGYFELEWPLSAVNISARLTSKALFSELQREPSIALFAVPDLALLNDDDVQTIRATWTGITAGCTASQRLFALIDAPKTIAATENMLSNLNNISLVNGSWGAAYWPYLKVKSSLGAAIHIPPSAAVAVMMQQIDASRGIWKPPANTALINIIEPEYSHLQGAGLFKQDETYINLIRSFPGRGTRVWGARTLSDGSDDALAYVQLRRLVSYIENTLADIGRFVVFEPNNDITWVKLKGVTSGWLYELWSDGALYGQSETEAFQISLGIGESMTVADIKAGKLIMSVSLALQYPAEFIQVSVQFDTRTLVSE
ncbi:MAG: phage tail sheath family protein [Rhodobacteraceae bacterium]|nr:phage tail sheath family protein [Paracoccaceae bacterium]